MEPVMNFIPKRRSGPEFLDLPPDTYRPEELEGSLADIRVVNRYLGDMRAMVKYLSLKTGGTTAFSLLDIATGSADIPAGIAAWARRAGKRAVITGVDINRQTIGIARRRCEGFPEIRLAVADGLDLPFADKSFDFVICSKITHHFTDEEAARLMGGMMRVAKRGYLIMDLRRSWIAWALIYILTRLFTTNRLTRYDGPLSVLRSFTPDELAALARRAGATEFAISREPFWLMVLAGEVS